MEQNIREEVKKAVNIMRQGGVILYPTDTVWGLGCDATNSNAVARIYEIKRRAESKALIVLTDSMTRTERYVENIPDIAWDLVDAADKPLTIIYDKARGLARNIIAEDGSIAIRVTHEIFSRALCETMRVPIVSTSANVSGENTPSNFADIAKEIIDSVDYVVKYRQNETSRPSPSSIIKLSAGGVVKVIR